MKLRFICRCYLCSIFSFASAYSEVEKCHLIFDGEVDTIQFESDMRREKEFEMNKQQILDALEKSIEISCRNIPKLQGNVALLCDCSGSVYGDGGGSSKVSAFSKTTRAAIGILFGWMSAKSQDDVYFGLFGDKLLSAPINRDKGLLAYNKEIYQLGDLCGKSTESGIYDFMREAVKQNKKIDNIVVLSDCQIVPRELKHLHGMKAISLLGMVIHMNIEGFHSMNCLRSLKRIILSVNGL